MKFRTVATAVAALATAVVLSSCGSEDPGSTAKDEPTTTQTPPAVEPVGTWGEDARKKPHLVLAEDGKVSGSDGCNRLMSTWKLTDETVTFSEVAGTLMACEGVDTWLLQMHTAVIDGDTMTVLNEGGKEIGTLTRS